MKTDGNALRILTIAALTLAATRLGAFAAQRNKEAPPIPIVLERIVEARKLDLVKSEDQFNMLDEPRLELRFGWKLPKGRSVVSIEQPESLTARDSAGTDLAKLPKNMFGSADHVTVIQEWQGPTKAFTVKLLPAARSAATFSLKASMQATTYAGTKTTTIVAGKEWMPLDESLVGRAGARVRIQHHGDTPGLAVQPVSLREHFEKVEFLGDGQPIESGSTMWNDKEVTYLFDMAPTASAKNAKIRLTVRTGLQTQPIVIDLNDQKLP